MARENQGLQIALIVFVMFTIILGVTTFMFSKEYSKQKALAEASDTKAAEANTAHSAAESENMRLKQVVGHAETSTLQVVDEQYANDKLTFARNMGVEDPSYRDMCQWLSDEVQRKNAALSTEKQRVQDEKDRAADVQTAANTQILQMRQRAEKAESDLADRTSEFQRSQLLLAQTNAKLGTDKQTVVDQSRDLLAKAEVEKSDLNNKMKKQDQYIDNLQGVIEEMDPPVVDNPDGIVIHAGRTDKVSINLGRIHGLERLTNFAVYARDMTDVTDAGRKGAIEVIDVFEDNAIAQIIDEDVSNPILGGDKIFTPLWMPGERQHFALTDGVDLDGDGRSDIDELRNLITSNGGVVDLYLDDLGQKYGEITTETKHIVKGEQPTDGSTTERLNARKWILDEAKKFNLRTLSVDELLNRMGYKRKVHVTRYDSKSKPSDFRARAPEGVPRISSGRVSDFYEKKNPPGPAVNSAY